MIVKKKQKNNKSWLELSKGLDKGFEFAKMNTLIPLPSFVFTNDGSFILS